jgi:alpha-N-arabinofuranosidase
MAWSDAMYGLSLHWYSSHAVHQPATGFDEAGWFHLMKQCLAIDELIQKHSEVMDRYDPEKRVGLIVDEWGAWYEVEPGTNPGFLFQQNTLRDALVAGLTLNIFNNRCDRVRMGNIAQTINVLQSMILTEGAKMIVTPTYHVFEMYKVHQDALMLPCNLDGSIYNLNGEEIPALSASASRDNQGKTHISICNADPNIDHELECDLIGIKLTSITGRILTSVKIDAHNTFDKPDEILPSAFDGITKKGDSFILSLPAKSVVVLEIN